MVHSVRNPIRLHFAIRSATVERWTPTARATASRLTRSFRRYAPLPTINSRRTRKSITLDLDLDIHRSPDSVRAWWTDLPDEYVAKDPREQPHRIRVLARQGDRVEVVGTWRGPLGREMLLKETLRLREDGSWTFDSRAMGISVHDEFEVVSLGEGARLHIRSVLTPARPLGRLVARLMGRRLVRRMAESWRTAALICERDAP